MYLGKYISYFNIISSKLKRLLAKPWLLPDKALSYFLARLTHCACLHADFFGLLQAILYSNRIDQWQRYASVAQQIKALGEQSFSILDVGGGSGTIREFLSPEKYRLCILDINFETLRRVGDSRLNIVIGDGCRLPFKDEAFDIVVSVDSLEHVPSTKKTNYCVEMKRVARRFVILHCPADSSNNMFQGTTYDAKFLNWYINCFKEGEPNTTEHLNSGLPRVEELLNIFPSSIVSGKQNGDVWLRYMKWEYTPYLRFFAGLLYKLFMEKKDDLPPFHACLLIWKK